MTGNGSPRIPLISERENLPENLRDQYDRIDESRGGVRGPFTVLLHSPEVAGRTGDLGAYLRYESRLNGAERETAILTTAREFDCAYEWAAHEPIARDQSVSEETIGIIVDREPVEGVLNPEETVVQYARELLRDHDISDHTFRTARDRFAVQGVVELTATIGYYSLIACILNAFDLEPDVDDPFD